MTTAAPRAIRVFVSSTFRDFSAEREELVKFVFPQLRKLCEQRGVTWGEVDLRWGITDEQRAEGKVLPLCLAEIERSRPYFIGLLGERYGWVPEQIPAELIEQEPWLAEHLEHSVTELEILHGVLNDPAMDKHAYFYLRSPAYVEAVPEQQREDYRETDEALVAKLAALKDRIRGSGFPVRQDYPDPEALGKLVLADLTALIESLYPAGSEPDALAREALEHEAFAASRAGVYVGRPEYFETLDAHAQSEGPPLVVTGESGAGKSALLANWALQRRETHPDELLLTHFVGASPASSDWAGMLRRLMGELQQRFEIEVEIPDSPEALRPAFANLLHMAAARGRLVLLIDALDQLEDRQGARELLWLPPQVPAEVRLILSTLPGASLDELTKRGWPTLTVEPLQPAERRELIAGYLAQYTKRLSGEHVQRLAAAPQSANPLYLRALLEELRVWGRHETLDERIAHYLAAAGPEELYALILERYEADYDRERPNLVREAMSLIWAARRGLSEAELLDLLGNDGRPLPRALWSPLYLAAEQSLVDRAGYLTFFHDYLREAVRRRYAPTPDAQQAVHLRLAGYFDTDERRLTTRGLDELPWQLAEAASWQRLNDLLADPIFLDAAWSEDEVGVKSCWAKVENGSQLRLTDACRPVLEHPAEHSSPFIYMLSRLLDETGHLAEGLRLRAFLVERSRAAGDLANLGTSLGVQATSLINSGEFDQATVLLEEQEGVCREVGDAAGLAMCLGNQAIILKVHGDLDRAMALLEEVERMCRELGDRAGLGRSLSNRATILEARGELDQALALLKEQERILRELGDRAELGLSLGNQAVALKGLGEFDQATALLEEQERIFRELGNRAGLASSLGHQAAVMFGRGEFDQAMARFEEQERICRELGNRAGLVSCLNNRGAILAERGELDQAMVVFQEQERICRELGHASGLATSLRNQAVLLADGARPRDALALAEEAYEIAVGAGLTRLAQQIQPVLDAVRGMG